MKLRTATPTDAEAVRQVHRASIESLGPSAYTSEQVDAWARGCESVDYAASITSDDLLFFVAEDASEILAFGSLCFESPSEYEACVDAEITGLYVHPSVARNGVGTALLTTMEQEAREQCRTLGLSASLNAVPFYEHHDYERVRAYTHEFSSSVSTGIEGQVVEMKKEL